MAQIMDIDKRAVDEFITTIINTARATVKEHVDEFVEELKICCW